MPLIELDDDFVNQAESYARASRRTTGEQIEYWYRIGRMAYKNPALSHEQIMERLAQDDS